jgi:hypothetical protein
MTIPRFDRAVRWHARLCLEVRGIGPGEAQQVSYNGYTYYVGVVGGKLLLANSRVSRRAEDPEQGFNRNLQVARAREIARYLAPNELTTHELAARR